MAKDETEEKGDLEEEETVKEDAVVSDEVTGDPSASEKDDEDGASAEKEEEKAKESIPAAPKKVVAEAGSLGLPKGDLIAIAIGLVGILCMVTARYFHADINLLYAGLGLAVLSVVVFFVSNLSR